MRRMRLADGVGSPFFDPLIHLRDLIRKRVRPGTTSNTVTAIGVIRVRVLPTDVHVAKHFRPRGCKLFMSPLGLRRFSSLPDNRCCGRLEKRRSSLAFLWG